MNVGSTLSQAWKLSGFAQSARANHEDPEKEKHEHVVEKG